MNDQPEQPGSKAEGNTLDFLLTAHRDAQAAKQFFRKALNAVHTQEPRVINVAMLRSSSVLTCLRSAIPVDPVP